jgi:hypothetical protein
MVTVALSGCTATGKTTLARALQRLLPALVVIQSDVHYLSAERCESVDLAALPWPAGQMPEAFVARGSADFNVPSSVDWNALGDDIAAAREVQRDRLLIVEGALLLSSHPTAAEIRSLCDHTVVLTADGQNRQAMEALWKRKWRRSRHGKSSYLDRGVTAEEYEVYWSHYVWPRWVEHGERHVPDDALQLDCLQSVDELTQRIQASQWWPS